MDSNTNYGNILNLNTNTNINTNMRITPTHAESQQQPLTFNHEISKKYTFGHSKQSSGHGTTNFSQLYERRS